MDLTHDPDGLTYYSHPIEVGEFTFALNASLRLYLVVHIGFEIRYYPISDTDTYNIRGLISSSHRCKPTVIVPIDSYANFVLTKSRSGDLLLATFPDFLHLAKMPAKTVSGVTDWYRSFRSDQGNSIHQSIKEAS